MLRTGSSCAILFMFLFSCITSGRVDAQRSKTWKEVFPYMRYADFHIHPTYKHYFRPKTIDSLRMILKAAVYDNKDNLVGFDQKTREIFKWTNWQKYTKHPNSALRNGTVSHLRNYDQAGYPEIIHVPGSILCNSYSPYEKQLALSNIKRKISAGGVTRMGKERLDSIAEDAHNPYDDFLAEYYYNLMQEEEALVEAYTPLHTYHKQGSEYSGLVRYYNRIKMVRDKKELDSISLINKIEFDKPVDGENPPHLITPMVMSIEGGQVLYGPYSALTKNIKNVHKYDSLVHNELLSNAHKLKNLPHRLFFITLGHFAQNHVVGYAKTLDRDPENIQHRGLAALSSIPILRNWIIEKTYDGFNEVDSIGFKIAEYFLNPATSKYGKPTYLDVKHMDVRARIQYYYKRRTWEKKYGVPIPIIASHFAVSGENQVLAAATGLYPHFDRYVENERPYKYYRHEILKGEIKPARESWWKDLMCGNGWGGMDKAFNNFERTMYKPLRFPYSDTTVKEFDPFENYDLQKNKEAGWFYPWSINLFDDEIIEIAKSDGIIGLLMDPRQHGGYMRNYNKKYRNYIHKEFDKQLVKLNEVDFEMAGLSRKDIFELDYVQIEPIIRNLFYIIRLLRHQEFADALYRKHDTASIRKYFNWFVPDDLSIEAKKAWDVIAIGSDFDGLIDPVDIAPTAAHIPRLHQKMIIYCYIFAQIHAEQYSEPTLNTADVRPLISSIKDSKEKMSKFFFTNGQEFIHKYF
jgi:hypothetical protein